MDSKVNLECFTWALVVVLIVFYVWFQPALPKVLDDDDEESEEEDQFTEHNHSLKDSVDFLFTTDEEVLKFKK